MKAFVIKNKEGKYYDCWAMDFTDIINECAIYQDKQTAENDIKNCIKNNEYLGCKNDCEVVEITIAADNLQKENEVLHRALELACENVSIVKVITEIIDTDGKTEATIDDVVNYYIQQAKEQCK